MIKFLLSIVVVCLCKFSAHLETITPHQSRTNKSLEYSNEISNPDVLGYTISHDTLNVVLKNTFVKYPFGIFTNIKSFQKAQPGTFISLTKRFSPTTGNNAKSEKVYNLVATQNSTLSYIGTYLNKNTNKFEIVSSIILNDRISVNGVMVGMTKKDFFDTVKDFSKINFENINVVRYEAEKNEINHYYRFSGEKLVEIKILSDSFYKLK